MIRNVVCCIIPTLCAWTAIVFPCSELRADQPPAYELIPASAQAVVWIPDSQALVDGWHQTQLARLAADDAVAPYFEARRDEIRDRLMDAGWRLKVQPEDLADYITGQLAMAWAVKEDSPLKPFITMLLADVDDDPKVNAQMLEDLEKNFDPEKTTKSTKTHQGVTITHYRMPPRPGELIQQDSYVAIVAGLLIITDDEGMVRQLVEKAQAGGMPEQSVAGDEVFQESRRRANIDGAGHIEYFVRPLGFARLLRAMSGNRSKNTSDTIAILENQGFSAILAVAGQLTLGQPTLDIEHHGFVLAHHPLPKSAAVLDFPNQVPHNVPNFVTDRVATLMVTSWNVQEAFWKMEGLVDDFAGTKGVFDEMIKGLKLDTNGPQIDIAADVLPNLTNDIYAITDNKPGEADVDSRRNLIAVRVKDPAKIQEVIDRAMRIEPGAEQVEVAGHAVWKYEYKEEEPLDSTFDDFDEFGDFDSSNQSEQAQEPEPWLSTWAIAVYGDYAMFASHAELIGEAIEQMKKSPVSPLTAQEDYRRAVSALEAQFGTDQACAWQIVRSDRAYRVQYELFRKGELRKSKSMLASILDRLLKDAEIRDQEQVISGEGLPEFDYIKKYLQPGATRVRSTQYGWEFGSILLSPGYQLPTPAKEAAIDTARFGDSAVPSRR